MSACYGKANWIEPASRGASTNDLQSPVLRCFEGSQANLETLKPLSLPAIPVAGQT